MEKLNYQEEAIMLVIWQVGKGFIKEYYNALPEPKPHYNTFASMLKNLERKGYIRQLRAVPGIEYEALIKENTYKKKFMSNVVDKYFQNSYANMVAFFTRNKEISVEELKQIIKMIEEDK
jgi:BlaI family penicillinase repressor